MRRIEFKNVPKFGALLKSHFFSGLLVCVPLAVIAWITFLALRSLWGLHEILPDGWQPESFLHDPTVATAVNIAFTLAAALALALAISILGWISKLYLGRRVLLFIGEVIQHIPVIRTVYSALDQLLRTVASGGGKQFNRVVYVEYPRKGVWALAFVTGPVKGPNAPAQHLNVYVPTTPNPTSGFHLMVPEGDVRESQMTVEEAFKTILSLGIAQPGNGS